MSAIAQAHHLLSPVLTRSPHQLPPLHNHTHTHAHTHHHSHSHSHSHPHSQHSSSSINYQQHQQRASNMLIARVSNRESTPRTLPKQYPASLDRNCNIAMPPGYTDRWGTFADKTAIANVYFDAFDDSKPRQYCFPESNRSVGQQWWEHEVSHWFDDAGAYYVRVVLDEATGEIVAFAKWSYHPHGFTAPPEDLDDGAPPAAQNPDIANHFFRIIDTSREVTHKFTPHLFLSLIGVGKAHQSRKISKKLMEWGIKQADQLGLPIYLESTMRGYPVYRHWGFEERGVIQYETTINGPHIPTQVQQFHDWPSMNLVILIRQPGAAQTKQRFNKSHCGRYLQQAWGDFDPFFRK